MLRQQSVPARARSGFATYFHGPASKPGFYIDHWVCEYWKANEQRWVLFDPEVGALEREYCRVTIDTDDVSRDQFLVAGRAWQLCRTGQADPNRFGILDEWGEWFIDDRLRVPAVIKRHSRTGPRLVDLMSHSLSTQPGRPPEMYWS